MATALAVKRWAGFLCTCALSRHNGLLACQRHGVAKPSEFKCNSLKQRAAVHHSAGAALGARYGCCLEGNRCWDEHRQCKQHCSCSQFLIHLITLSDAPSLVLHRSTSWARRHVSAAACAYGAGAPGGATSTITTSTKCQCDYLHPPQEYFLGRAGMFGLLPALTGEALPGARPVVAEGNLLRRGPVVFRIPPNALSALRRDADGGDPACEQLMLDLYRYIPLGQAITSDHIKRIGQFGGMSILSWQQQPLGAGGRRRQLLLRAAHAASVTGRWLCRQSCCAFSAAWTTCWGLGWISQPRRPCQKNLFLLGLPLQVHCVSVMCVSGPVLP